MHEEHPMKTIADAAELLDQEKAANSNLTNISITEINKPAK